MTMMAIGVWLAKGAITYIGAQAAGYSWSMWGQNILDVIGAWI